MLTNEKLKVGNGWCFSLKTDLKDDYHSFCLLTNLLTLIGCDDRHDSPLSHSLKYYKNSHIGI